MKKIIALIVLLFFICAPSLGAADKATELIDEAITLLNVGLTGITITQQDIFLIKDLKTWAKESGMEKSLSELKDKNAFVLVKEPGKKAHIHFPLFVRQDTKFWREAQNLQNRSAAVGSVASVLLHELCHALGQPDENSCRSVEIQYLEDLQQQGRFTGKEADAYLSNVKKTFEAEQISFNR